MRRITLLGLGLAVFCAGCGTRGVVVPGSERSDAEGETPVRLSRDPKNYSTPAPVPESVRACIVSIRDGAQARPSNSIEPFHLPLDADGDGVREEAVLVEAEAADGRMLNGLLICRRGEAAARFGPLFFDGTARSSFDEDNFITQDWEILAITEIAPYLRRSMNAQPLEATPGAEAVAFHFDGGSVYIVWDGIGYSVIEGG